MTRFRRAIRKRFQALELPLVLVTFALGVYLAAGTILLAANFPDHKTWTPWSGWFVALLVSAVWVPVYALIQTIQARLQARAELGREARRSLALFCQQIVGAIAHSCANVSVTALAACIWICRDDDTFDEVARFYLPYERPALGVRWHKGKGVAGWAWATNEDLFSDLRPLIAKLDEPDPQAFERLPESARLGLSAAELKSTRVYTGVVAIRLFSTDGKAKLLGMLILDYVGSEGFDCIREQAQKWPVTNYTGACARILTDAGAKL